MKVESRDRFEWIAMFLVCLATLSAVFLARSWEVPYLALLVAATAGALGAGFLVRPRWGALATIALTVPLSTIGYLGWHDGTRGQETRRPPGEMRADLEQRAASVMPELADAARRMLRATVQDEPGRRHVAVERLLPTDALGEAAGLLRSGGRAIAWAGSVRVATGDLQGSAGVARNEFYLVAWARDSSGSRAAIAMRTLSATPPATSLSRSFAAVVARTLGLASIRVSLTPDGGVPVAENGNGGALAWLTPVAAEGAAIDARRDALWRAALLARAFALLTLLIAGTWVAGDRRWPRLAAVGVATLALGAAPLSLLSNVAPVYSAVLFFTPLGGPFTASPGALASFGALAVLATLLLFRRRRWHPSLVVAFPIAALAIAGSPMLLSRLAEGVSLPQRGAGATQWVAWQLALFLTSVPIALVPAWLASAPRGGRRWLALLASAVAMLGGLSAPLVWDVAQRSFPPWYVVGWGIVFALLIASRSRRSLVMHAGIVVACASAVVLWSSVTRQRVELAERDVEGLSIADEQTQALIERLYLSAQRDGVAPSRAALLRLYVGSDLAAAGNPAELAVWDNAGATSAPAAELVVAQVQRRAEGERGLVQEATASGIPLLREYASRQGLHLVLAAPLDSTRVLSVVVAPRSQLIDDDPFAALLGLDVPSVVEPPYRLTLGTAAPGHSSRDPEWQRRDDELHGDWLVDSALGNLHAHVEVELRALDALAARGILLILLDLAALGLLWTIVGAGDRALRRWIRRRAGRWWGSYRARLTLALFGAFVVPSIAFGIWTLNRLAVEDRTSRALLVQETLRAVRVDSPEALAAESERLQTRLIRYDNGELTATADRLQLDLAPLGRLLDPVAADKVVFGREAVANRRITLGMVPTLIGYRALGGGVVLAAPARRTELTLERQRGDVLSLLLVALALGAAVAWALSGVAAVAFAEPIGALRRAADDVARGARDLPSLAVHPATEFGPVFRRFRAMAVELGDSRDALEASRRRTEAVLRDVASGVVALDRESRVVLANPLAERILGHPLPSGAKLQDPVGTVIGEQMAGFAHRDSDEVEFDLPHRGRQIRARLTRLTRGDGGVVLTLDDVTDVARAQRVFAWAEMARQVAHEIKNPLTPIRLGVQHLRRAHADQRPDFPEILSQNVDRVLQEIDRLDEIARSFSKFGVRPGDLPPPDAVQLEDVVEEVVDLERMGDRTIEWQVDVPSDLMVRAREGELHEVMLNLMENARLAAARHVTIRASRDGVHVVLTVRDDGEGVPDDVLNRVFEPRFSTRTSGSGLGLAICKRLVESWGGRISLERSPDRGTLVKVTMEGASP